MDIKLPSGCGALELTPFQSKLLKYIESLYNIKITSASKGSVSGVFYIDYYTLKGSTDYSATFIEGQDFLSTVQRLISVLKKRKKDVV